MAKVKAAPEQPRRRARDILLSQQSRTQCEIYDDPEAGPIVFRQPGFKSSLKLQGLDTEDRLIFMLMNFVFDPVFGPDDQPLIDDHGQPLYGKPVFDKADEEYLRTTDHPIDGWFMRLVRELGEFVQRSTDEVEAGKKLATG